MGESTADKAARGVLGVAGMHHAHRTTPEFDRNSRKDAVGWWGASGAS